ncbi:MAG: PepSY domain-containing protein [Defluviitaleaceae bacterium]|nr:PepSY domain-containing protein [Defluviitaleaceae bacterium]
MDNGARPTETIARKKKPVLAVAAIVLLIIAAVITFFMWPGSISRDEATNIAIEHIGGGRANRPDMDFEQFRRVWSVEVHHDGFTHEVFVSRINGEVLKVEIDRWD